MEDATRGALDRFDPDAGLLMVATCFMTVLAFSDPSPMVGLAALPVVGWVVTIVGIRVITGRERSRRT